LIAVKQSAPAPAFEALFELTDTCLPERMRAKVQDAVRKHKIAEVIY
jgi:hypothetical protein